jgi:TolB-like protein
MITRWLRWTGCLLSACVLLSAPSWAGQVVTQEVKAWAQKAVQEEKVLKAPPARNTLAVLYFKNQTGQPEIDPLQKGIALLLITDLSKIKGLQVVERVQLQALAEELGLGASGLVDPDTAPRVGRLLGVRWIAGGEILRGKVDELRIQSSPLEVATQEILGQPFSEGQFRELFRIEKELLFDLIKLLRVEVTPAEQEDLRRPCSTNLQALMALFRAITASDRKEYARAAEFYETALREDERICVARRALEELRSLGLIAGAKKSRELLRSLRDQTSFTDQLPPEEANKREKTPKDIPTPANIGIVFPR